MTSSTPTNWTRVCSFDDVPEEGAIRVWIDETPICIARSNGDIHALQDVCSHAEVALSEGEVEAGTVECWLHGSRFDLKTGKPTGLPATKPVPVYATNVDNGDVFVDLEKKQ
jgi:3-phenylpropionate/trans-cinnamate dioxygenase ferredoxin component